MSEPASSAWSVQEVTGLPWSLPTPIAGDLPDINIWLALAVQEHPHHAFARAYWASVVAASAADAQPRVWFCRTTMLGLVRLLCQPRWWAPVRSTCPPPGISTKAIGPCRKLTCYPILWHASLKSAICSSAPRATRTALDRHLSGGAGASRWPAAGDV